MATVEKEEEEEDGINLKTNFFLFPHTVASDGGLRLWSEKG